MANPDLRYTYADGRMASEFMPCVIGEAMVDARLMRYSDGSEMWFDRAGLALPQLLQHDGEENDQSRQGDEGVQGGNPAHRQTGSRKRSSGKKPQASDRNRAV